MEEFYSSHTKVRVKRAHVNKMRNLEEFVGAFKHHEAKLSHILDMGRVVKYASRSLTYEEYCEFCSLVGIEEKPQHMLRQIGDITEEVRCNHLGHRVKLGLGLMHMFFSELS